MMLLAKLEPAWVSRESGASQACLFSLHAVLTDNLMKWEIYINFAKVAEDTSSTLL